MQEPTGMDRRAILLLIGIITLFLIGSVIMLTRYYFIVPDSTYLLALGKNIVTGNGLTINDGPHFRYPPAYGFVSGLFYLVIGNLEAAGHLVSILSGLATIILVYIYTSSTYNKKTALIASLILAINPLFLWISTSAAAEGFYALALSAFILMILKLIRRPNWWMALLTGLIAGVAYLTRAEGFLLFPLGLITLLVAWFRGKHGIKSILLPLVLFIIGWLVLGFPYLIFLKENIGEWTLSGKIVQNIERVSEAIYIEDYESLRDVPLHEYESPGLIPYLVQNFPRVVERYIGFTWLAIKDAIFRAAPVLLLFIWYIILALRDGTKRGWHFLLFALPLLVYPLAHIENRYVTPTLVALVPVISWGLKLSLDSKIKDDRFLLLRRFLAIVFLILLAIGNWLYIGRIPGPPIEHRILANWMAESLPDVRDSRIAASFPYVSFYLDNEDFRYLPKADTLEEIIDLARERKIEYIVIDERSTPARRPQLEVLLDPENATDDISLVLELDYPDVPNRIVLYRVNLDSE